MADFGTDVELEEFRAEARDWLVANFPASLKGKAALASAEVTQTDPALKLWRQRIGAKGWATPTWPAMVT